jgi:hypothetical protein
VPSSRVIERIGDNAPVTEMLCRGWRTAAAPIGCRAVSSRRTSITPVSSVNRVETSAPARATSAITTVPRMPATAFGVRISIDSRGRMRSLATESAIVPDARSTLDIRGDSVIVTTDRSRTVTSALPPRRMRTSDSSPVAIRSLRNTGSRKLSDRGAARLARVTVAVP